MKIYNNKIITGLVLLIMLILITVTDGYGQKIKRLKVSKKNPHYLVTADNKPFFLNVDAVWGIVYSCHGQYDFLEGWKTKYLSDQLQGTRGADNSYALIYSARGGDIKVFVDKLKGPSISAYWYNPRTGKWHVKGKEYKKPRPFAKGIRSGSGAPVYTFSPPHGEKDKNDWVLRLTSN